MSTGEGSEALQKLSLGEEGEIYRSGSFSFLFVFFSQTSGAGPGRECHVMGPEALAPLIRTLPSQRLVGEVAPDRKQICASRAQLLVLGRGQVRPLWLAFLKTPTCVLSMATM